MRKRTVAFGASLAAAAAFGATSLPSTAQTTPIVGEPLSLRASFPDDVSMKIKLKDQSELDGLMTEEQYQEFVKSIS